jgi:hypothetical protein
MESPADRFVHTEKIVFVKLAITQDNLKTVIIIPAELNKNAMY